MYAVVHICSLEILHVGMPKWHLLSENKVKAEEKCEADITGIAFDIFC